MLFKKLINATRALFVTLLVATLAACGGGQGGDSTQGNGGEGGQEGGNGGGSTATLYALGGTISGLTSGVLYLSNGINNTALVVLPNSSTFTFLDQFATGSAYNVSVQTQPTSPGPTCSVANGSGTMGAASVSNVAVTCGYKLGGTISGLTGSGLVLANGADTLPVSANASSFTFAHPIAVGTTYSVSVQTQPGGLSCSILANGSGTMGAADINNVGINCI